MSVRNQKDILKDAVNVGGYYYMNIYDVFDYKSKLNREKERQIVEFLQQYLSGEETPQRAEELFRQIGKVIGKEE
jgi:arginine exporter protein ArgO